MARPRQTHLNRAQQIGISAKQAGMTAAQIAKAAGVSRECARLWFLPGSLVYECYTRYKETGHLYPPIKLPAMTAKEKAAWDDELQTIFRFSRLLDRFEPPEHVRKANPHAWQRKQLALLKMAESGFDGDDFPGGPARDAYESTMPYLHSDGLWQAARDRELEE